ncbi:MAG TPA: hypothetical protein VMV46_02530 [Thermoanaerobaculia bacterium]|nr:hypothetical protein [Thermoanaerobaculia bacterium]
MDRIFETLFKYRPGLFRQGELTFATAWPWAAAVVAAVVVLAILLIWRRPAGVGPGRQWLLLGLRFAALGVVALCLLQPSLVLSSVLPQQSFVGVLIDDSQSMQVRDGGGEGASRADIAAGALSPLPGSLRSLLEPRFQVRVFSFARDARRIEGPEELTFAGSESRIDRALAEAGDELSAVPLSGLVLLTDGAQTSDEGLADVLLELESRSVPVYPVGVGSDRLPRDLEITRVVAPRSVLQGSSLQVDVTIAQQGFAGTTQRLEIEDEGRIVAAQEVRFPANGDAVVASAVFTATEEGPRRFRFRLGAQPGEVLTENNERWALIQVEDRRDKVLYFEGEPRWELKFLKRAIQEDENLQLVTLARMAENRFGRLEVDAADELAGGFPTTREELFAYKGLVLGSIEASFFTYDQMRMILDFVSQRGGGVLFLGGRAAFAEGGYGGTPIEEAMPVALGPASGGEGRGGFFAPVRVRPTPFGLAHPATQIFGELAADGAAERWSALPELSVLNPLWELKPGATALLVGESRALDREQVVLAHQRYGRGRAIALTVHDSWLWQMQQPLEDTSFETFWRQIVRWLVSYVPRPVEVAADRDRVSPGQPVTLTALVRDQRYLEVNRARVEAAITSPGGEVTRVPLDWTVEQDGEFRGTFTPGELGIHRVETVARAEGEELGAGLAHFEVSETSEELYGAHRRRDLLERIAADTGGRFLEPGDYEELVDELAYSQEGATVRELRDLWDMPAVFLTLLGLLGAEWTLRRRFGLS